MTLQRWERDVGVVEYWGETKMTRQSRVIVREYWPGDVERDAELQKTSRRRPQSLSDLEATTSAIPIAAGLSSELVPLDSSSDSPSESPLDSPLDLDQVGRGLDDFRARLRSRANKSLAEEEKESFDVESKPGTELLPAIKETPAGPTTPLETDWLIRAEHLLTTAQAEILSQAQRALNDDPRG